MIKLHDLIRESDLGLTLKKGKTITVTHNKSGKEIVIVDKPVVRKEYEKIGYFVESINEIKMDMENFTDKLLDALEGDTADLSFGIKHNNKIEKMMGDIMDVDTYYQVKDKKEMIKGLKKVKSNVAKIKSLNKSIFDKVLSDIDTAHKTFEVNIQKRI